MLKILPTSSLCFSFHIVANFKCMALNPKILSWTTALTIFRSDSCQSTAALTSIVVIVQFPVELGGFYEPGFHHLHLLWLKLFLHGLKLHLHVQVHINKKNLSETYCFKDIIRFSLWNVTGACACKSFRSFSSRSLSDVSVSSSWDADSLAPLSSASSANNSATWTIAHTESHAKCACVMQTPQ